jgi:translation initiation factor 3 subunit I
LGLIAESDEPDLVIPTQESKATVAGWSFLDRYIIMGHENGAVSQWDAKTGEKLADAHEHNLLVTDLQFAPDRTYFITASKDKTAKVLPSTADFDGRSGTHQIYPYSRLTFPTPHSTPLA